MKYCQECGKPIDDLAKFCSYCGTAQLAPTEEQKAEKEPVRMQFEEHKAGAPKKLHCPNCKSRNIVHTVEVETTDGAALLGNTFSGLGLASFSAQKEMQYDWLCKDCGIRFPNIQTIRKKIPQYAQAQTAAKWVSILIAMIAICFALLAIWDMVLVMVGCEGLMYALFAHAKRREESLTRELYRLQADCFD